MNDSMNSQEFPTHWDETQRNRNASMDSQDQFSKDNTLESSTSEERPNIRGATKVSQNCSSSFNECTNELTTSTESKIDQEVCRIIDPVNALLLEFLEKQKKKVEKMKEKLLREMRDNDAEIESWSEKVVSIPAAFDLLDDPLSDNESQKEEFKKLKNKSNATLLEFSRGCLLNAKFKKVRQEKKRALLDEMLLAWHIAKEFLSGRFHFGGCSMAKSLSSMGQSSPFVILSKFIIQNKSKLTKERDDLVEKIRLLETECSLWDVLKRNNESSMLENDDDEATKIVIPKLNQFIDLEKEKVKREGKKLFTGGCEFKIAALDGMINLWHIEEEKLAHAFPSATSDQHEIRIPVTEKVNHSRVVEDIEMRDLSKDKCDTSVSGGKCDVSEGITFGAKESHGFPQYGFNKSVYHIFEPFKTSDSNGCLQTGSLASASDYFSTFGVSKSSSFPQGRCSTGASESLFGIDYGKRVSSNFPLFTANTFGRFCPNAFSTKASTSTTQNELRKIDSTSFPQIGFNSCKSNVFAQFRSNANEYSDLYFNFFAKSNVCEKSTNNTNEFSNLARIVPAKSNVPAQSRNNVNESGKVADKVDSAEISSNRDDVPSSATSSNLLDDILENPNLSFVIQSVKGFLSAPPENDEDEEIEKHLANLSKVKEILDASDTHSSSVVKSNSIDAKDAVVTNVSRNFPKKVVKYFEISQASDENSKSSVISDSIDGTTNFTNKLVKRRGKRPRSNTNTSSIVNNSIDDAATVANNSYKNLRTSDANNLLAVASNSFDDTGNVAERSFKCKKHKGL